MIKSTLPLLCSIVYISTNNPAGAQSQSVGNGSVIGPSPAEMEKYGVSSPQPSQSGEGWATRHYRIEKRTGIGGSFLETTAPTSESSPAVKALTANPASRLRLRSSVISPPKIESVFAEGNLPSPALELSNLSSNIKTDALNSPVIAPNSISSPSLENLPSFSQRNSISNQVQFDTFGSSNKLGF